MSDIMIKAENLSKRYRIGTAEKGYKTIRETIMEGISAPVRNLRRLGKMTNFKNGDEADTIWALKDVSFEVKEGEVLGIIGRNGSGKSTLLKVLSRITEPTAGYAEIHGRVSSLLEVGTGFHPELTGRENIFLNGGILGMRKKEIERKFDDIVAFSEIGKYIDTPVKRYSSGMYVRLAFAVAAHLEPEILLVDEVLAVGDIGFQKKCLGKMGDIAKSGRTVLFISHNMYFIRELCESAICLDSGQIVKRGPADEVVREYEERQSKPFIESNCVTIRSPLEVKGKNFYIARADVTDTGGNNTNGFKYNDTLIVTMDFAGEPIGNYFSPEFRIYNDLGQHVTTGASGPYFGQFYDKTVKRVVINIGPLTLTSGKYRISLSLMTGSIRADIWDNAAVFNITECKPFPKPYEMPTHVEGVCVIPYTFSK